MGATDRVRSAKDFQAIYRGRRSVGVRALVFVYRENDLGHSRLGLSVGRRHGGAVRRNRLKRLIREVFRHHRVLVPGQYDIIAIPRDARRLDNYADVERVFADVCRRWKRELDEKSP